MLFLILINHSKKTFSKKMTKIRGFQQYQTPLENLQKGFNILSLKNLTS